MTSVPLSSGLSLRTVLTTCLPTIRRRTDETAGFTASKCGHPGQVSSSVHVEATSCRRRTQRAAHRGNNDISPPLLRALNSVVPTNGLKMRLFAAPFIGTGANARSSWESSCAAAILRWLITSGSSLRMSLSTSLARRGPTTTPSRSNSRQRRKPGSSRRGFVF